jgi:hypothetical protein
MASKNFNVEWPTEVKPIKLAEVDQDDSQKPFRIAFQWLGNDVAVGALFLNSFMKQVRARYGEPNIYNVAMGGDWSFKIEGKSLSMKPGFWCGGVVGDLESADESSMELDFAFYGYSEKEVRESLDWPKPTKMKRREVMKPCDVPNHFAGLIHSASACQVSYAVEEHPPNARSHTLAFAWKGSSKMKAYDLFPPIVLAIREQVGQEALVGHPNSGRWRYIAEIDEISYGSISQANGHFFYSEESSEIYAALTAYFDDENDAMLCRIAGF